MDRSFVAQLNDYRITTAEILYWMPDHKHVLQSFVWQFHDISPDYPRLARFLDHWRREIEAVIHSVEVAHKVHRPGADYRPAIFHRQLH